MAEVRYINDPVEAVRDEVLRIDRQSGMDPQEERERLEAVDAYFGEDEQHFVDFVEEMVRTSADANRDIRAIQQECWRVYQEDSPPNYSHKETWQSRVVLPKPHGAVQFAMAAVDQAFKPEFLSIQDERNKGLAEFWRKLMMIQLNRQHAKFVNRFTAATGMGFAVGQSFEMIPVWRPGKGLDFSMAEPWKIHRDPDALSQTPQSGMYWIHEEWQDLFALHAAELNGRYVNTFNLRGEQHEETNPQNYQMDRHRAAELRKQIWTRNKFRQSVLTREYWGQVLSSRGELLHSNLWFTTAGRNVIGLPRPSPYRTLRWPGMSFSPLPNFLRFEGRSLLQSVRSLWYYMCNLQALHSDYMNWQVNPMLEINQQGLADQDDIDPFPGRVWLTRNTVSGQQVVRTVDRKFTSGEVLLNLQYGDQVFQKGTFITDAIQGLPGYRQQVTARESAQNLQQSLTVFGIIGQNLDFGAIDILQACLETIMLHITPSELLQLFSMAELLNYFPGGDGGLPSIFTSDPSVSPTGVILPPITGTFRISGLQSLLKDQQTMRAIRDVILPMSLNPAFQPYLRMHKVAKAIELRSNLQDEGLLVDDEEAEKIADGIKQSQGQLQQMQQEAFQRQQQLLEVRAQLELRKSELEQMRVQIEARKADAEIQQKQIEMLARQKEIDGDNEVRELELAQMQVELERKVSENFQLEQEMRLAVIELEADLRKTEAQIEKTEAQIMLAERKADLEEKRLRASQGSMQSEGADGS